MNVLARVSRLVLLLSVFLVASCAGSDQQASQTQQGASSAVLSARPELAPTVESGKAAVVGRAINQTNAQPMAKINVRLAEIYWDADHKSGALALDESNSPSTIADDQGYFVFNNVEARDYAVIFRNLDNPGDSDVIVPEVKDGDKARIITTAQGQVLDLGQLSAKQP